MSELKLLETISCLSARAGYLEGVLMGLYFRVEEQDRDLIETVLGDLADEGGRYGLPFTTETDTDL